MKYTVEGFSQQNMVELGLDMVDAGLLRFIVDFHASGSMAKKTFAGKEYFWLKYQYVIDEMPIIGIKSKIALARRLQKMVDADVLEKHLHQEGGNYTFFRFGKAYDSLLGFNSNVGSSKLKSIESLNSKVSTDYSSIKDKSIKNKETDPRKKHLIDHFFNCFVEKTNTKPRVNGPKWAKIFEGLLKLYTEEQIRHIINFFFAYRTRVDFRIETFNAKFELLAPIALERMPKKGVVEIEELRPGDEGYKELAITHYDGYRDE